MDTIIKKRVERLVLLNHEQQKSKEWYNKRHNLVTASDIAAIFDVHPYMTNKQLLIKKCSEPRIEGNVYTEWGELFEPIATQIYKKMFLVEKIHESGCIIHSKYKFLGASPDGILPSGKLLEIKCPMTRSINNNIPNMYWIQMQIQMEVCNLNECDFFQCKFYKYENKEEYINDVTANHKGHLEECDVYWKLDKFTICNVKRDTKWFIKNIGAIERFWNSVIYYRSVGIENINNQKNEFYQIIDWTMWIAASQVKNYMLNDTCLDYIQILNRGMPKLYDGCNVKKTDAKLLDKNIDYGSTFIEMICNQGLVFERNVVSILREQFDIKTVCTDITTSRSALKFKETVKYMQQGVPIIYQGVLHGHMSKTYGIPDLIVRSDIVNSLVKEPVYTEEEEKIGCFLHDSYHYVIVDIKYSTLKLCSDGKHLTNNGIMKANKGQMCIYNMILEEIQDYQPNKCFILGKKWKYTKNGDTHSNNSCFDRLGTIDFVNNDEGYLQKVDDALEWCRELRENFHKYQLFPPNDPKLFPNMCNVYDSPYHAVKCKLADEISEITSIWYCNANNRDHAIARGIDTWMDKKCTIDSLNVTGEWRRPRIQAILDINRQNSDKIRCMNYQNIANWKTEYDTDLFVDFETVNMNDFVNENGEIYSKDESIITMIGVGWCDQGKWKFTQFTVDTITYEEEERIVQNLYDFLKTFNKKSVGKPRLFHWGHIEKTILNKLIKKYPGKDWYCPNWVDLCKIIQDEIIVFKGALNYNLKTVCKSLFKNKLTNTSWSSVSKCANGLDAMVSMLKCDVIAKKNQISLKTMGIIHDIEKYNEVDCKAMWEILNIMRSRIARNGLHESIEIIEKNESI